MRVFDGLECACSCISGDLLIIDVVQRPTCSQTDSTFLCPESRCHSKDLGIKASSTSIQIISSAFVSPVLPISRSAEVEGLGFMATSIAVKG